MARTHAVSTGSMKMPRVLVLRRPTVCIPAHMAACAVHCQQSPSNKILSLGNCRAKNLCRSQTSCTVFHPSLKLGPKLWHSEDSLFPREPLQRFRIQYYHCYRLPRFFNFDWKAVTLVTVTWDMTCWKWAHFQRFLEVCWLASSTLLRKKACHGTCLRKSATDCWDESHI